MRMSNKWTPIVESVQAFGKMADAAERYVLA